MKKWLDKIFYKSIEAILENSKTTHEDLLFAKDCLDKKINIDLDDFNKSAKEIIDDIKYLYR